VPPVKSCVAVTVSVVIETSFGPPERFRGPQGPLFLRFRDFFQVSLDLLRPAV
jgi:hypothetical protein